MFLNGTMGIVIGGPAILVMSAVPDVVGGHGPDASHGMTTIAGSWIGGGANQASTKEMFEAGGDIFAMVTADVIVANYGWLYCY